MGGVEQCGRKNINMLQLKLTLEDGGISVRPALKVTSLGMPLSHLSCHPLHVHASWPLSCVRSLGGLSSHPTFAESAKEQLISRFRRHFAPACLIAALEATPVEASVRRPRDLVGPLFDEFMPRWLTLGFHPAPSRVGLSKALRRFSSSALIQSWWWEAFGSRAQLPFLRIAWKNVLPSVGSILQRGGRS